MQSVKPDETQYVYTHSCFFLNFVLSKLISCIFSPCGIILHVQQIALFASNKMHNRDQLLKMKSATLIVCGCMLALVA